VSGERYGLVLCAHPDDEVLFAGATMLAHPEIRWTVICLTYNDHDWRGLEMQRAMAAFRQHGLDIGGSCLGVPDNGWPPTASWYATALSKVMHALGERVWDIVLTHSASGEYGHAHHIAVNSIARHNFSSPWEFRYPGLTGVGPQGLRARVVSVPVTAAKAAVFEAAYAAQLPGLRTHMPELMAYELDHGPELFTGDGVWPL
jgi:LmbE family N-acetylglucosaminyl deacetylase